MEGNKLVLYTEVTSRFILTGIPLNTVADKYKSSLISIWTVNLQGRPYDLLTDLLLINVTCHIFCHIYFACGFHVRAELAKSGTITSIAIYEAGDYLRLLWKRFVFLIAFFSPNAITCQLMDWTC
jgi:hypothetical protein